jgi:hypothetical protein
MKLIGFLISCNGITFTPNPANLKVEIWKDIFINTHNKQDGDLNGLNFLFVSKLG